MDAITDLLKRELVARASAEEGDENIGSARDEEGKNTSISGLVSALSFNLVIFGVLVLAFIVLRRANKRIYAPRTYVSFNVSTGCHWVVLMGAKIGWYR